MGSGRCGCRPCRQPVHPRAAVRPWPAAHAAVLHHAAPRPTATPGRGRPPRLAAAARNAGALQLQLRCAVAACPPSGRLCWFVHTRAADHHLQPLQRPPKPAACTACITAVFHAIKCSQDRGSDRRINFRAGPTATPARQQLEVGGEGRWQSADLVTFAFASMGRNEVTGTARTWVLLFRHVLRRHLRLPPGGGRGGCS